MVCLRLFQMFMAVDKKLSSYINLWIPHGIARSFLVAAEPSSGGYYIEPSSGGYIEPSSVDIIQSLVMVDI